MAQCGGNPSRYAATKPTEKNLVVVADRAGNNWSRLLTNLGIPWATIQSIKAESSTNLWDACMNGLVIWLKGGVSDSNEPVTFGTLFAALKDSGMADCVSLLVDRLDERSTPHPRPTHEDKDKDPSTPPSKRGKKKEDSEMTDCVSLLVDRLDERSAPHPRPTHEDEDEDLSTPTSERGKEKDTLLQEKDTLIAKLLEENQRLKQASPASSKRLHPFLQKKDTVTQLQEKDTQLQEKGTLIAKLLEEIERLKQASPASSSSPAKLFKPGQTKPPRNWKELKWQKTLKCGGYCCWSISVQGDVVCVGVEGRVLLFSKTSGTQVSELGSNQIEGYVYGVAFIDEDTIVVSDDERLRTYTTKGQLVSTFDSGGGRFVLGLGKYAFSPRGLTVGPDGRIFVCDNGNHCVCVFNVDGKLLSSFGSEGSGVGQFNHPSDVCMDGEGLLFISDGGNSRICVHSVEGAFIREFPTARQPCYVAATHCNHLVVSSYSSDTVLIMTTSGQLVHEFGGEGRGPGQFSWPYGVAVDNEDCVYVCDACSYRVQVY